MIWNFGNLNRGMTSYNSSQIINICKIKLLLLLKMFSILKFLQNYMNLMILKKLFRDVK